MTIARLIAEDALRQSDPLRLAGAHIMRYRILLGLTDTRPEDLTPLAANIRDILTASPAPPPKPTYLMGDLETLTNLERSAVLTLMERRIVPVEEEELRQMLHEVRARLKGKLLQPRRFQAHVVAARLHLILEETFQAQEHIDEAFKSGELKNLHVYEICGLFKGRVLARTESPQVAAAYLQEVIGNCRKSLDSYHQRLAEYDLTRLESLAFPG